MVEELRKCQFGSTWKLWYQLHSNKLKIFKFLLVKAPHSTFFLLILQRHANSERGLEDLVFDGRAHQERESGEALPAFPE